MYAKLVKEFSSASADLNSIQPTPLSKEKVEFIEEMILDEMDELKQSNSLTDQMDAFADMIYYLLDTCHKTGVDLDPIFEIVHQANMKKVVNGKVILREDGKVLKPPSWEPPEFFIEAEIERQKKLKKN